MRPALVVSFVAAAVLVGVATVTVDAGPNLRPIVIRAHSGKVKPGEEEQRCHRRRFPRRQETDIGRVEMRVKGGSHHVHLYRPYNGEVVYPTRDCPFAIDFSKWQLVTATQNAALDWQLPPGVAINFLPRQQLLVQTHFVNTGLLTTRGKARAEIVLHPIDPGAVAGGVQHAGAIFAQDRVLRPLGTAGSGVPPGRTTVTSRCSLTGEGGEARDMTILAFTGHYHFRGVQFQVYRVNVDGTLGELLYQNDGYQEPKFVQYPADNPLVLHAGEGIEWWCTYQNDTTQTFEFGPNTQRNEHCNLFGFYYPTETPQEAIDCIHMIDDAGVEQNVRIVAQ